MLLYSGLLTVALTAWTLRYLVPILRAPGGREGLTERFGRNASALAPAVAGKRVIWVQAVSVGEVLAASRLIGELETALGEGWRVVISTTTKTGQALAKEKFGADRVFYMPLDFAFAVRAYLRVLKPAAVVLIESEVWPRMMHECRKLGVPVIVVNARVSDRSFNRSLKVRWIWSRVLRQATLWLAQSEEDARRLVAMGAPANAVRVGGNLKYDIRAPKQSRVAEMIHEAAAGRPIVVAGSTVGNAKSDEEEWLITVWGGRAKNQCNAMLVLAPRHPERFKEVWEDAIEFPSVKVTDLLLDKNTLPTWGVLRPEPPCKAEIIVLDTIGDLAAVYGIADVAFIGGSLLKRGGHNPLEAAQFGVPVLIGPSFENFRDVVTKMQAAEGIVITAGEAESTEDSCIGPAQIEMRDSLEKKLVELLTNRDEARAIGEAGRAVYEAQQGATKRAIEAIVSMIGAKL